MSELHSLISHLDDSLQTSITALILNSLKPVTFYTLPKIIKHSPTNLCTDVINSNPRKMHELMESLKFYLLGRSKVSGIGNLIQYISDYIDQIVKPLLPSISSYIKDTTHFLRIMSYIDSLPDNALLVILDVSCLYSNIPHGEGILTCKIYENQRLPPNTRFEIFRTLYILYSNITTSS